MNTNADPLRSRWDAVRDRGMHYETSDAFHELLALRRRIKIQERYESIGARRKRVPYADGFRFIAVDHTGTACYQTDNLLLISEFIQDHPYCRVIDLDAFDGVQNKRQIGQYMAPREPQRAIMPVFDPTAGKAGKFGQTTESLLKDRKTSQVLPSPADVTPRLTILLNQIAHRQLGTPLIGTQGRSVPCKSCGFDSAHCDCKQTRTFTVSPSLAPVGPRQPIPLASTWMVETMSFTEQSRIIREHESWAKRNMGEQE